MMTMTMTLSADNNDVSSICRGLADTDADGKMTLIEFSIACKLINLKLRGFDVPKQIPPTLLSSLSTAGGTPIMTPPSRMSPVLFSRPIIPPQPAIPPQPMMMPQPQAAAAPPPIPPQPMIPHPVAAPIQPLIQAAAPIIPPQPAIPPQPVAMAPSLPSSLTSPVQAAAPLNNLLIRKPSGGNLLDSLDNASDMTLLTNGAAPKPPSQPGTRSGSISETNIPYEAK